MDTKSTVVLLLLASFCVIALSVQSKARLERIHALEDADVAAIDQYQECHFALETAQSELATCLQDNEAMEMSLDVASADLRGCGQFYAQREYAADADY